MIRLTNIKFRYPSSDFHLEIPGLGLDKASKTAFIGPSGFGKTTLLNLLAGILLPEQGQVQVGESLVNNLGENERRDFRITNIGFVFQDFRLIAYLDVLDNILLPYRINSIMKMADATVQSAKELATDLGIGNKLRKYPARLSHGERQRVAICRALLNRPPLILADEPTGNLDPDNKRRIMHILFDYVNRHGSTLVMVTHDHEMLSDFDKVIDFKTLRKN